MVWYSPETNEKLCEKNSDTASFAKKQNAEHDMEKLCEKLKQHLSFDLMQFAFPSHKFSRLLAIGRLAEPMRVMYQFDGPAT
jgi:hypothetical protein